jgi:peptidoglycan/LPS O-acetylase OafA/YrhL
MPPLKLAPVKLPQLDVLRGICALLVVFYHVLFLHPGYELGLFRNAALFVDFFFVLSGFIMFHNYRNMESWPAFKRFIGLRFFRTYPMHLVMVGVYLAYETLQYALVRIYDLPTSTPPFSGNNATTLLLNLLLLNGVGIAPLSFNTPSWSISTEFWAYVVFGLSVLMMGRGRNLPFLFATLALGSLGFLAAQPEPSLTGQWELFLPRCLYGFFLGATLRAVTRIEPDAQPSDRTVAARSGVGGLVQLAAIGAAVGLVTAATNERLWLELLTPFAFAAVISSVIAWPHTTLVRALRNPALLWLGTVSYSIYMVHQFVLQMVQAFMRIVLHAPVQDELILVSRGVGGLALLFALGLVLIIAALTYRYVEEPARRFGRVWLDRHVEEHTRVTPASEPSALSSR